VQLRREIAQVAALPALEITVWIDGAEDRRQAHHLVHDQPVEQLRVATRTDGPDPDVDDRAQQRMVPEALFGLGHATLT